MDKITNQGGFVALTSTVVIAVLLIAVTLSLNLTGFFARFNVLETEYKERSFSLAEACVQTALLKLAADSFDAESLHFFCHHLVAQLPRPPPRFPPNGDFGLTIPSNT